MIVQWFFDLMSAIITGLYGALMSLIPPPPSWLIDHAEDVSAVWQVIAGFETWVPVALTFQIATAVAGAWVVGMAVGLVRVIVSYLTLGGGAT